MANEYTMLFTRDRREECVHIHVRRKLMMLVVKRERERDEEETGEKNFAQRDLTQTKPEERVNHGQRTS